MNVNTSGVHHLGTSQLGIYAQGRMKMVGRTHLAETGAKAAAVTNDADGKHPSPFLTHLMKMVGKDKLFER